MRIGIIGFGDFGKQMYNFLKGDELYLSSDFYVFDDVVNNEDKEPNCYLFNDFRKNEFSDLIFFVCLGYKRLVEKEIVLSWLQLNRRKLGTYIHPSSIINSHANIDPGVVVYPGCIIDQRVSLKKGVILNNGVIVSHDSVIESSCFLAPGVIVCGFCKIGAKSFVGAGATISDNIIVGSNCMIGINSSVTKNLEDNSSVIGNPLKNKKFTL